MKHTKAEIMEDIKHDKAKIIDNNTIEYYTDGTRTIRLHFTDIVTFNPDSSITLNSGGWKTPTTKDRINSYSPYRIYQLNSLWYITVNDKEYIFKDGITIYKNGKVVGAEVKKQNYSKEIKTYIDGFVSELTKRKIDKPGSGDCWYCLLKTDKGESWGNSDHILSHFREKYYVPSLLMNALEKYPIGTIQMSIVGYWLKYLDKGMKCFDNVAIDSVKRSLRRYLKFQLGLAA